MSLVAAALSVFGLQAAAMFVDELHFHRLRGLPLWERIGHPVDTATVLACYLWALAGPLAGRRLAIYAAAAALSCLCITKDEAVHARHCMAAEHWLHAVLFVLHPLALLAAALLRLSGMNALLALQCGLTSAFLGYQMVYWRVAR